MPAATAAAAPSPPSSRKRSRSPHSDDDGGDAPLPPPRARGPAASQPALPWMRVPLPVAGGAGVPLARTRFSAAFGRAFGYYDGVMFEVRSAALGEDQPVAAGGRYDSLPGRLGAELPTGAVGCMVRPGRAWVGARP